MIKVNEPMNERYFINFDKVVFEDEDEIENDNENLNENLIINKSKN